MQQESKPICIVIDTNIWISDSNLLLKTPLGAALLYNLKLINGYIGLPEIIEEEVIKHTIRVGQEAVQKIKTNFRKIEIIIGSRSIYDLPNENQIESIARERFAELKHLIIKIPFTFEQAKSALNRVNEGSQPNGEKDQQFKDSVIWEAILTIINDYTIHFITKDKAFYQDRKPESGKLAENLLNDCQKLGGYVHIYKDIESFLAKIRKNVPSINYQSLILEVDKVINSSLAREMISETGFEIINLASDISSVSAFLTEKIDQLALSFEIKYNLVDVKNEGDYEREDAVLTVTGECLYELDEKVISNVKMESERMTWLELTGELGRRGRVFLRTTIGNDKEVKYTFKEKLK